MLNYTIINVPLKYISPLGTGCDIAGDCDENANCGLWDEHGGKYICQCNSGYSGDGNTCTKNKPEVNSY